MIDLVSVRLEVSGEVERQYFMPRSLIRQKRHRWDVLNLRLFSQRIFKTADGSKLNTLEKPL